MSEQHMTPNDKRSYSPRLYNADLAPAQNKNWTWYNMFSFWMSDVHSVGGYIVAASLFAFGLAGWQVLLCLLIGICIVLFFANLMAKPCQESGVPVAVLCRQAFGVFGANIPAVTRGLIAVAWYGIQTYLASHGLMIVLLKFFPELGYLNEMSWLGLSGLGWFCFVAMWFSQAVVFWYGMETIKRFIDFAGPAVYVVMFLLAGWIVYQVGPSNISFTLSDKVLSMGEQFWFMLMAIALVVSYFSGPLLNYGDFTRYMKSMDELKKGNFWGLPINFLLFSVITVVIVSGTVPLFGEMIKDPLETVSRMGNGLVIAIGVLTIVIATIGINIVANFVSPAFDFSNCSPQRISFRTGGLIAAVGSVLVTPWNLFNSPEIIHYTLDVLAAVIGPLFGILLVQHYFISKGKINIDALFSDQPGQPYWYRGGFNPRAIIALILSVVVGVAIILIPHLKELANFSWFIGVFVGSALYYFLAKDSKVDG
ncbi:NCS1 family nucleobase:cation symporter-1 [Entomomonas moraniae]|uniref:NCS1 family nucleobase:cation symporter-1 n=2 Tax=Entomomonas moraniae TaxID=2213226 RepID=A0A3S9XEJ4_9GAMM|nr:NCS1 family nucleobase:cation symporter-1 [Entomomonas moraniae]AZS50887.1 NCS1 family nucleobase:cation symporter-1 [Entomomonas moraniae]